MLKHSPLGLLNLSSQVERLIFKAIKRLFNGNSEAFSPITNINMNYFLARGAVQQLKINST